MKGCFYGLAFFLLILSGAEVEASHDAPQSCECKK